MAQALPVGIWREGGRFLARCLPLGVVSEGASREEALEHLRQGLSLYLGGPSPRLVAVGSPVDGP